MLEATERIERYLARGWEAFQRDELLQNWMTHHLQIIGEAASHVPDTIRGSAPEVPWSDIVGMRHVLVHGYFEVDLDLVWATVSQDIPRPRVPLSASSECSASSSDRRPPIAARPTLPKSGFAKRGAVLQAKMADANLDVLVAHGDEADPANVLYLEEW